MPALSKTDRPWVPACTGPGRGQIEKQKTKRTLVLDPLAGDKTPYTAPALPMVVVYRGLGPETGKEWFKYDTADWMVDQIYNNSSLPLEFRDNVIFVVPYDYSEKCKLLDCLHEAEQKLIDNRNGETSFYSLCGFSRGGACVYDPLNLYLRDWSILGLIDPVLPSNIEVLDNFAHRIRCVYGLKTWGDKDTQGRRQVFFEHLASKGAKVVWREDVIHQDMPALFFYTYGSDLVFSSPCE
jgi:hypothetical protein